MEQSNAIDPNDLLIFGLVADLGSFSRAADKARLPKSTVSRRIAALEKRLGERLLLRTTRRQTLTEFGHLLLAHARQVTAEMDAVARLRERCQAEPSGRLRVSMPNEVATLMLAEPMSAFVALYPQISLEIDLSSRRVDLLGEGFDLAVRMGPLTDDGLLAARRLSLMSAGLYASPDYLAEHGEPKIPDDLLSHDAVHLLGAQGQPRPWVLTKASERWEHTPPGRIIANLPDILYRLTRAGAGIAALPDYIASPDVQRGQLRRVLPLWCLPPATVSAVFPGRTLMPSKTRVFIEMLVTTFDSLR